MDKAKNRTLVKRLARELRYRPLPELVGQEIMIHSVESVEEDLREALAPFLPGQAQYEWPHSPFLERTLAKYGILDVTFRAPASLLQGEAEQGVPLLKKLGFLPDPSILEQMPLTFENDPTCLAELHDDLSEESTFLRLWLASEPPQGESPLALPPSYLPRRFKLRDACMANATLVWFHKHFYL